MKNKVFVLLFIFTYQNLWAEFSSHCASLFLQPDRQLHQSLDFLYGSSDMINLRLLAKLEEIDPQILKSTSELLSKSSRSSRQKTHELALKFSSESTRENKEALYNALQILIPIAIRPILHLVKNNEQWEDLIQRGREQLWIDLDNIPKTDPKLLRKLSYWLGINNGLRASIFSAMRSEYRSQYSITPVSFLKTNSFTWQELLLLFSDREGVIEGIKSKFNLTDTDIQNEFDVQRASIGTDKLDETNAEQISAEKSVIDGQNKKNISTIITERLSPRYERVIRLRYFEDKTLKEVAELYGVTIELIRQIEIKSLERILKGLKVEKGIKKLNPTELTEQNEILPLMPPEERQKKVIANIKSQIDRKALALTQIELEIRKAKAQEILDKSGIDMRIGDFLLKKMEPSSNEPQVNIATDIILQIERTNFVAWVTEYQKLRKILHSLTNPAKNSDELKNLIDRKKIGDGKIDQDFTNLREQEFAQALEIAEFSFMPFKKRFQAYSKALAIEQHFIITTANLVLEIKNNPKSEEAKKTFEDKKRVALKDIQNALSEVYIIE